MNETVNLTGYIENVTFRNDENGFTVFDFESDDGEFITCTGVVGSYYPGEKLTLSGVYTYHPTFGKQFKVESVICNIPETVDEMLLFLSSGIIKGVKDKTAMKLVKEFGDKTFDIIENHPERLAKIKGITIDRANEISKQFKEKADERRSVIELERIGLSSNEAIRIFNLFGRRAPELVECNPYMLCNQGIGIDFERACRIAASLDSAPDDDFRVQEGIIYIIRHNLNNGHTCVPRESLFAPAADLLDCSRDAFDIATDKLLASNRIISNAVNGREFLFMPDMYYAEKDAAKQVLFIKDFVKGFKCDIDSLINKSEMIGGVCYNEKQKLAVRTAVEKGVLILTGGPGTGKTTTLRGILKVFENLGLEVELTAPTGRAAKRMSELTGRDARTIHRLLEVEFDENDKTRFKRNRRNPITADAVIVDELSMVDVVLFSNLLDALPMGCRLVMVGDSDQLPPVGAGNVLHDLIDSKALPVIELDEVFRQAMESLIIQNAHRIVSGDELILDKTDKDFFFMERNNPTAAVKTISELVGKRLVDAYGYSPVNDIQVLCPSRKGECGTVNINKILQQVLNPASDEKKEKNIGTRIFRIGDKLMMVKNNYDIMWTTDNSEGLGVFNGDIGILEKIDEVNLCYKIRFDDKLATVPFECNSELEHAYAVTIHKSQGNEFNAVIIPVVGINEYLQYRNLLYTAVTRAKAMIILVGSKSVITAMIRNDKKQKRYSALRSFIITGDD